MINRKKY